MQFLSFGTGSFFSPSLSTIPLWCRAVRLIFEFVGRACVLSVPTLQPIINIVFLHSFNLRPSPTMFASKFKMLFAFFLPVALAAPLPYVILPHTSATTVSATPTSTSLATATTLPILANVPITPEYEYPTLFHH